LVVEQNHAATVIPEECTFEQSLNKSLHSKLVVKAKPSKRTVISKSVAEPPTKVQRNCSDFTLIEATDLPSTPKAVAMILADTGNTLLDSPKLKSLMAAPETRRG